MQYSSSNRVGSRFCNYDDTGGLDFGSLIAKLRDYIANGQRFPPTLLPVCCLDRKIFAAGHPGLRITWLGHSTVLVEIDGHIVLVDPVFSFRVSPLPGLGPKRFHARLPLESGDLPTIDAVLISHDHYDHLDRTTIMAIHSKVKKFFVPLGVARFLTRWGVPEQKVTQLDWWQQVEWGGLTLVATPSQHYSGRGIRFNRTLWTSWAILGSLHRVFFSGDSGYCRVFKEIGERYGPFNVTMIEAGQYNSIWPQIHMQPEQSVQAHRDVGGEIMLPVHWATFSLSSHAWNEPVKRVLRAARQYQVLVATPRPGEQVDYDRGLIPAESWWEQIH